MHNFAMTDELSENDSIHSQIVTQWEVIKAFLTNLAAASRME